MTRQEPGRDPESEFEDQGIPDLQDGTPEQQWSEDPQEAPLPGESPVGLDSYGTTAEEQRTGEDLDGRLAREQRDPAADPDAAEQPRQENIRPADRLVAEDEGVRADTEKDEVAFDVGPDGGGYSPEEQAVHIEEE